MATARADKRRLILDAAIRVFARRGFHHCRVSDVADEAGVAYGLVYHYFESKEEILNTLFLERSAHSFGRVHLETIQDAYARIAQIVEKGREEGSFKSDIPAQFAAMCFYGAIEQLLSGWIFGLVPEKEEEFERAKSLVVEAICGGLEPAPTGAPVSG
jgi:AcrR family transcriptional regulator